MLNFIENVVDHSLGLAGSKDVCLGTAARIKITADTLEILRITVKVYGRNGSSSDNSGVLRILLCVTSCLHVELITAYQANETHWRGTDNGASSKLNNLWEMQTYAFSMIGDALSRIGSSISPNLWQRAVEALRKVLDFLASKNLVIENIIMSRFYTTLLNCLHLVLTDTKGSISGHVAGFVAALQLFFMYGLPSRLPSALTNSGLAINSRDQKSGLTESQKDTRAPYRPPHLRKRNGSIMHPADSPSSSDSELSKYALSSSDSDHSDNDLSMKDGDRYRSSRARIAALVCIQDLCHADPKTLSSLWTYLLPENDVLQPRKYQATLMTCLLFDPVLKIRLASASALAALLDGHALVFLQVAEYKETAKCGSFTTLSSSLGQILMQLHTGIFYLIQHETHSGLLASSFKILMLLIAATPYNRMPAELLRTILASLRSKILEDLVLRIEHTGLLVGAISCLEASFLRSPPSFAVLELLKEDISNGCVQAEQGSSLISLLLQFSEQGRHQTVRFESLQALRAVAHNYPNISSEIWAHISDIVHGLLQFSSSDDSSNDNITSSWKGDADKALESSTEKHIMAALKVLDECLRAASGFRGADGPLECRLRDIQHISDSTKVLKISSAPSYALGGPETLKFYAVDSPSGNNQWCEVIDRHLPLALTHSSPLVRATAVTCFAGMTSSVFFSLTEEKQEFIISSAVYAALNDKATSVRSAACRAIGVISCMPQIFSSTRVLNDFIRAAEINTHDSIASVRITASWALANICDSLRQRVNELHLDTPLGEVTYDESISILVETSLRLTKDGDKIKSNAVRALGNLSRFIRFLSSSIEKRGRDSIHSHSSSQGIETSQSKVSELAFCQDPSWLQRMVQAFVSCVTTGNVKVQWNVCHAMSNLFMNDSLKLPDMFWAPTVYSILLLLLRDSTNFKIRIHAAVALAVPTSRHDYGNSFPDVVQGLEHVLESMSSEQAVDPSSYKYKDHLEKQLMLTTLHVLGFASSKDDPALQAFLIKKAAFLEEWLKTECLPCLEFGDQSSASVTTRTENQDAGTISGVPKRAMLFRAINALLGVYKSNDLHGVAQRFEILVGSCS